CIVIQDVTQKIKNIIQRETFFDILTHDLKTPMRANIQVLELLLKNKFGNIDNELKSVLEELLNSCKFMNYMADNLIIKYKNEDKFKDLQKQKYSIVKLVKDKCESLIGVLERRKQTIEFVVKGTIPDTNIDIEKIGNVIKNLIINASEQSIEKSKIVIQIENNEKNVSVSFWDNGYPSNRENPDEIFEEYFTTVNRLRKVGFSLEFSNCKKIIEAHDGKIHAQNIVNRGNIISFSLPLAG
ncbi:MAG: HAMP domain-containing histidine kinase, partial [Candidatus Gastranaerophilales bacterium]|nr:HAMP domain-containing histidine kinase [Candidatus Gastranaerophilales bacterium]